MITDKAKEEFKSTIDPLCILQHIAYKKSSPIDAGNEIRDYCPIHHGDKQRSLAINKETNTFYCHTCCEKGDLIRLYMLSTNKNFPDAYQDLRNNLGLEPRYVPAQKTTVSKAKRTPQQVIDESVPLVSHPYLTSKKVDACEGLYIGTDGSIIVPLRDINGELKSEQFIREKLSGGDKRSKPYLKGTKTKGAFFIIGELETSNEIWLAEGLATALSIWMAFEKKRTVISFGSAGNLVNVCHDIAEKYPTKQLTVCLDKGDAAFKQAHRLHKEYPDLKLTYCIPCFDGLTYEAADKEPTDFNDLVSRCNLTELKVQKQLEKTITINEVPLPSQKELDLTHSSNESCKENQFAYLLEKNTKEKLIAELKNTEPCISTGYKIGEIDLAFPGGAISIVATPTSHGKTTLLNNFALGVIEENPKKNVYFFSYEESAAAIQIAFVNTYTSKRIHKINPNEKALSKNNKRSIESYYRGTDEFITQGLHLEFNLGQKAFFKEIIDTGKLKVIYTDMKADQLVNGIRFIKENDPNVGMIYIDYIQMLQAETPRLSRQEQLKQICLMLKDCAIETGLPIVLAAQFNRTVVSEADLSCVNIGEAGDIERIASLIIGGFNRNFHMMSKLGNTDKEGKTVPKESTIYMEVLKGRNIGAGHFCVMDFDGNKGLVTNNINYDNKTVSSEITIKEAPKNQMIT